MNVAVSRSELKDYIDDIIDTLDLLTKAGRVADLSENKSLYIDYNDLLITMPERFDSTYLLDNPVQSLKVFEKRIVERLGESHDIDEIHVRITNLPKSRTLKVRELRVSDLYNMVAIDGLVTQLTKVVPNIVSQVHRCERCRSMIRKDVEGNKLQEPPKCPECDKPNNKTHFELIEEECRYIDYQMVEIQDPPESLQGHEQPERLECWISDDICGKLKLSDHVRLVGTLKNRRRNKNNRTGDWVLKVNSIDVKNTEFEEMDISEEDVEMIKEIGSDEQIFAKVVRSIAPSIKGYTMVKHGLALELFGGTRKNMDGQRIRGNIHVLMVGDPGTAKSQLIQRMARISPRGMSGSGKGTTGAGLTAAAQQTEVLGESKWVVEAGTLVLSDKGLAAIDELDKMSANDRSALHEAMEQQTVTIDKATIHTKFNARTSVLAACNPTEGRFEPNIQLSKQIGLPPPLLSRFDLIYPIRDVVEEEKDKKISEHILKLHTEGQKMLNDENYTPDKKFKAPIERETLRKYISYAKTIVPVFTDEAIEHIDEYYRRARERGQKANSPVPITARQEESMIRMSEASARLHLREKITIEDAKYATGLMDHYLQKVVGDDIDLVMSSTSYDERSTKRHIMDIVEEMQKDYGYDGVPIGQLRERIVDEDIDLDKGLKWLKKLREGGILFQPKQDHFKVVE